MSVEMGGASWRVGHGSRGIYGVGVLCVQFARNV